MVLIWLLIIVAIVWLVLLLAGGSSGAGKGARQILDERFARGETDRQEYEEKRRLLR